MATWAFASGWIAGARAQAPYIVADYDTGTAYVLRGDVATATEREIFGMKKSWVFNKAMQWMDATAIGANGTIAYSTGNQILLTGTARQSEWFAGGADTITHNSDGTMRCQKLDTSRAWAQFDLPPLQIHRSQHPTLTVEVTSANRDWQVLVFPKGRSGPPLFTGAWKSGSGTENIDLAGLYATKGYTNPYSEIQVIIATETGSNTNTADLTARVSLPTVAALVAGYPVIRSSGNAVTLLALPLNASGQPMGATGLSVTAQINGQSVVMSRLASGVWSGQAPALPVGRHDATLSATWPGGSGVARQIVLVTDGVGTTYDQTRRSLVRSGSALGPQTGSYRAQPMFQNVGTAEESLVHGQAAWDAVKGSTHRGQFGNWGGPLYTYHAWESLTDDEIATDYAYLRSCGWDVVHLTQGWWIWDRWDAAGHLAPMAAEQLARSIGSAMHNNLRFYLALSHYPYGYWSDPPQEYIDAGYTGYESKATSPQLSDFNSPFWTLYGAYLDDITAFLAQASPVAMVSSSGEGDSKMPNAFIEQTRTYLNNAGVPGVRVTEEKDLNWPGAMAGYRTYSVDSTSKTLEDIAGWFDSNVGPRKFHVEGGFWGYSGGYTDTAAYRRKVRQIMYAGFARRFPTMMTWEERVTEDEHLIVSKARRLIDWQNTAWVTGNAPPTDLLTLPAGWRAQVSISTDRNTAIAFLTRNATSATANATVSLANGTGTRLLTAWDLATKTTLAEDVASPSGKTLALDASATEVLMVIRPQPAAGTNQAPAISAPADQTLETNQATTALSFPVSDAETAASSLVVSAASSNTLLVPTANVTLGGSGANRTVTVTPAANQSGWSDIVLTVSDGSLTSSARFRVTVGSSDPSLVTLGVSPASISENGGMSTVTVSMTPARSVPVTVTLAASGSAVSGTDYSLGSTTITIDPGQGSATTQLAALNNSAWLGNRTCVLDIIAVSGGGIAVESGVQQVSVTIVEDELPPPLVTLSASAATFGEASSTTVTATLNQTMPQAVTIVLSADGTASPGTDFSMGNGTITIPAGQLTASLTITGIDDSHWEGSESILLTPASVSGGAITNLGEQVTLSVTDDESAPVQVNIDFGTASSALYSGHGPASGNGTIVSGNQTWNRVSSASAASLLSVSGGTSAVGLAISGHTGFYDGAGNAGTAQPLTRDYVYKTGSSGFTVTLSGLTPGASYALWFMGTAGQYTGYGCKVSLDGVTRESSWSPQNASTWVEGQNYFTFGSVTANATGHISALILPNSVRGDESDLSGLQIRSSAPVVPAVPRGLVATAQSTSTIQLSWTDNSTTETGFKIERASSASGPFTLVHTTGSNVTTWTDSGLPQEATRYYRVRATTSATDTQATAITSATTFSDPLSQWRQDFWGTTSNSGNAADQADPDADGVANLLEYVLGTSPNDSNDSAIPELLPNGNHLTLTFTPSVVSGLSYIIEASDDLSDWSDATDITALLTADEPYTYTDSASLATNSRRFLRLRVESTSP